MRNGSNGLAFRWARGLAFHALLVVAALPAVGVAAERMPSHERLQLRSVVMSETRRLNVYLPPDYDACTAATYPVLYLPDGGEEEDFPHVAQAADRLIRAKRVRPFLIVGIENTVRRRDMTGPTQSPDDLKVTNQPGGAPLFRRFLRSELMPLVRNRYRTTPEAAVMGESLAGLFVVDTLLHEPTLFGTYVALDPSLWWNANGAIREASQELGNLPDASIRLLLVAAGQEGNAEQGEAFATALRRFAPSRLNWRFDVRQGVRHDTIYRAVDADMLVAIFAVEKAGVGSMAQPCERHEAG